MKTAVLDSGFVGSTQQTIPLVLEPTHRPVRKSKRVVVPFSISRPQLEVPDARMQVPKLVICERLELGIVTVLLASAATLIVLAVTAAANL
jgi:hypothetical protein